MSMWTCVKRWLSQATCDKTELNRKIIRIKKCFDEANDVVCGKKEIGAGRQSVKLRKLRKRRK